MLLEFQRLDTPLFFQVLLSVVWEVFDELHQSTSLVLRWFSLNTFQHIMALTLGKYLCCLLWMYLDEAESHLASGAGGGEFAHVMCGRKDFQILTMRPTICITKSPFLAVPYLSCAYLILILQFTRVGWFAYRILKISRMSPNKVFMFLITPPPFPSGNAKIPKLIAKHVHVFECFQKKVNTIGLNQLIITY